MRNKLGPLLGVAHKTIRGASDGHELVVLKRADLIKLAKDAAAKWENPLTAILARKPEAYLEFSSRFLLAAGIVAQKISIGAFLWAPIADGQYMFGGEMTPIMWPCLGDLTLPPFARLLTSLDTRIGLGLGYDAESENLFYELERVVGPKDTVLTRLRVKRGMWRKKKTP